MTKLSILLNILVLIPVCLGIFTNANWTINCYGNNTPARSILLSVYLSIFFSIILLFKPDPKMVAALLCVQIIYKITTPLTVGSFSNAVVISNILIALFHCFTVFLYLTVSQFFLIWKFLTS